MNRLSKRSEPNYVEKNCAFFRNKTIVEVFIMKTRVQKKVVPTLKFNSDYFRCPRCGWKYPEPLLVKGDVASSTRCQNCGNSYLVRIK